LDPGHGGPEPGAANDRYGLVESQIALEIAELAANRVREIMPRARVILTRTDDVGLTLEARCAMANSLEADAFVSIHLNASSEEVRRGGVTTFVLDTSNDRRDGHLKSADFFEADKYPMITFESSSVEAAGENQLLAHGTLTIKDQSKAVDLPITVLGIQAVPAELQGNFGKEVASFSAKLSIDRRDYGVGVGNWAATLVVGSNVDIDLVVEANHQ